MNEELKTELNKINSARNTIEEQIDVMLENNLLPDNFKDELKMYRINVLNHPTEIMSVFERIHKYFEEAEKQIYFD